MKYKIWGTIGICLCLVVGGTTILKNTMSDHKTDSANVQIPNPLHEVQSLNEMEETLKYKIPVLDKEVDAYIVIDDEKTQIARIEYADQSTFNMASGTGDISGIYGGVFEEEKEIDHVKVSFYEYEGIESTINYALWEKDGFTYSYAGAEISEEEIQDLLQ